ncbi:MAG: hypothetical protein A2V93_03055 [Ignavibacteria bacterium RBG_16_34_14]|nr:MAG: hypothetical protein A2V93_03055 [Ignavibacteria bacterium RBG_16_34_14]
MGFSSLLDIIGSTLIGGMLLLILFRLNDASAENTYNNSGELTSQQNISTVVQILETDFRKIGFCKDWNKIPNPTQAIILADSNKIKFLTDVEADGNVDTMYYYIGSTNEILTTPNPRDRYLYRVVNGELPVKVNLGITEFSLLYFDVISDTLSFPITVPGAIQSMQINVAVENVDAYDNEYSSVFWRQIRLAAQNLNNR